MKYQTRVRIQGFEGREAEGLFALRVLLFKWGSVFEVEWSRYKPWVSR